jgi:hypothetical protein
MARNLPWKYRTQPGKPDTWREQANGYALPVSSRPFSCRCIVGHCCAEQRYSHHHCNNALTTVLMGTTLSVLEYSTIKVVIASECMRHKRTCGHALDTKERLRGTRAPSEAQSPLLQQRRSRAEQRCRLQRG